MGDESNLDPQLGVDLPVVPGDGVEVSGAEDGRAVEVLQYV